VISCSWRPEAETLEDPWTDVRGVKKRVKRLGVIGGGFLGFLLPIVGGAVGGDELGHSEGGSRSPKRAVHGDDIVLIKHVSSRSN
jgi:hypothetical protein